jgi:DNA-directed RNA polymerase subunit F
VGAVPVDPTLVRHLVATTGLTAAEATRVVEDVLAFHAEPVEDYVRRRHAELKTFGARNPEIFARLAEELAHRLVAAPPLSERQLRRIVYG